MLQSFNWRRWKRYRNMNFNNVNEPNDIKLYALEKLKWSILCYLYFTTMKEAINDILRTTRETWCSVIITFLRNHNKSNNNNQLIWEQDNVHILRNIFWNIDDKMPWHMWLALKWFIAIKNEETEHTHCTHLSHL